MRNDKCLLVTFASWEDRFGLGFRRDVGRFEVPRVLVLYFEQYAEWTTASRDDVRALCDTCGVECVWLRLDVSEPATNWRAVAMAMEKTIKDCGRLLVDISTMPREIIWYVLWLAARGSIDVSYVYHSPENYGESWLSRDPRAPRLVYKLSGMALPSRRTALAVTAGFDLQRVVRLIEWCEPSVLLVGLQSESQFARNAEEMEIYREKIRKELGCEFFEVDAYSDDHGLGAVRGQLANVEGKYNIIASSLGPKLTAIALYKLQMAMPAVGLVYAPATEFSKNYSSGIGQAFWGDMGFRDEIAGRDEQ